MTIVKVGLSKEQSLEHTRRVRVSKLSDSRVGVGLVQAGRLITVAEVFSSSPLEGHVWPGDIIRGVAGVPLPPKTDAHSLANVFRLASDLDLNVETPALLSDARTLFLISAANEPGGFVELGIELEKDPSTGMARVSGLGPGSLAATTIDRSSLARGDLIVAVGAGGTLARASTVKECNALLAKHATEGAIELRLLRPSGWPSAGPRASWEAGAHPSPQKPATPPPAYAESCGALSTLTSLLERSKLVATDSLEMQLEGGL